MSKNTRSTFLVMVMFLLLVLALPVLAITGDIVSFGKDSNGNDITRVDKNGHLIPGVTGTYNVGSSSLRWLTGYFTSINSSGTITQNGNQVKLSGDILTNIYQPENLYGLDRSSNGTVTLTRNAQGDWSFNETASGAETTYVSCVVPWLQQTSGMGYELTSVTVAYQLGVADATSVDVYADGTVYAQGVSPAVTNSIEGAVVDGSYDSNHNTAAKRKDHTVASGEHLLTLTFPTAAYYVTTGGQVRVEAKFVLANTGTLKVRAVVPTYSILTQ